MSESMHLLTGAYAVNALDPAERAEFEAHLAGCPDCQAEVRGLLDTTSRLAAAEAVEPPARLKAAVMAQIATTRQLPPLDAGEPAPASDDGVVVPLRRPGWTWGQRSLAIAAAVLAVVAVSLSTLLVQSNSARTRVDATQAAVTRVLTASDATVKHTSLGGGTKVTIVVSPSQRTSVFLGDGLPAAPSGHTYELWYLGASGAVPAGTFHPDSSGHVAKVLTGSVGGASTIGVTVEPAGGSQQPTTKPMVALQFS